MDTRGAVQLHLPAVTFDGVDISASQRQQLDRWADDSWYLDAGWSEQQLTRLALASVIDSRLLHVRRTRLAAFGLDKHPDQVTLRQLAALWRPHFGLAGQAFELAVVDACNRGVPDVLTPLDRALSLLGVPASSAPRMLALGLEKIPAGQRGEFAADLGSHLPADAVLRTGQRGRPARVGTVLERLTGSTWASMATGHPEHASTGGAPTGRLGLDDGDEGPWEEQAWRESQLGRADALAYTETALVPVSLKINSWAALRHEGGWKHVPLWVTRSSRDTSVRAVNGAKVPTVVVALGATSWSRAFDTALLLLDRLMADLDQGRAWTSPGTAGPNPVGGRMRRMADEPITAVTDVLRNVHPGVRELFEPHLNVHPSTLGLATLDAPTLTTGWRQDAADGNLLLNGHPHLFRRDTDHLAPGS